MLGTIVQTNYYLDYKPHFQKETLKINFYPLFLYYLYIVKMS